MRDITNSEPLLHAVIINVEDIQQALAFYRDLLGFPVVDQFTRSHDVICTTHVLDVGNSHRLHLCSYDVPLQPSPWLDNNYQQGIRHIGFQVLDTDATTARLKAAHVPFTLDPVDTPIGARIAFFQAPDGTLLELVEGDIDYHQLGIVDFPPRCDRPQTSGQGELVFDHVDMTVPDLEQALQFYQGLLYFPLIGQVSFNDDRGFVITYLRAGLGVLGLFTFTAPTIPLPAQIPDTTMGLHRNLFKVDDLEDATARLQGASTPTLTDPTADFRVTAPGGAVLTFAQHNRPN